MLRKFMNTRLTLGSALLCGSLATMALVASCSDNSTPPASTPAAAKSESAASKPAVADQAGSALKSAGNETAKAVNDTAKVAAAETKKSADAAQAALKAGEQKIRDSASALKAAPTPVALPAGHSADDGHDHGAPDAAAAKKAAPPAKGVDGANPDTDPNSKARISYEFGSEVHNFGKVMQGDVLNHKFNMTSSGEEDLVIKQAKPTCGCTVAQIMIQEADNTMVAYTMGKPIPPGRKVEIGATLHTQNKRGHAGSKINMFTNDPRGQTILSLDAEVDPYFQVNPPNINFNKMSQKDTATDKISVTTTKGEKVKLSASSDNLPQGLKFTLNPIDPDAEGKSARWELVATAGPGLAEGNLAYSVPMRSDVPIPGGEKMPNGVMPSYEISTTIMAQVTGSVAYTPAFVSLGLIRPGQTLARSVRVTSYDPNFKLTDPKVVIQGRDTPEWELSKYFTPVVRPVPNENAVDVEVTLNGMPETLTGSFSGMLVITIGHPEKPEIKLPITGVCRGGTPTQAAPVAPVPPTGQPK